MDSGNSDSELFYLKWNNYQDNFASGFADLLQQEAMVDVTLAVEGKIVQAHKIILSVCSSYFRDMFQVNPCKHPIVVLKDVGYKELTDLLDFMYKGETKVDQQDLPAFLKLADTLKIKGLVQNQTGKNVMTNKKSSSIILKDESENLENKEVIIRKKRRRPGVSFKPLEVKSASSNVESVSPEKKKKSLVEEFISFKADVTTESISPETKKKNLVEQLITFKEEAMTDEASQDTDDENLNQSHSEDVTGDYLNAGPSGLEETNDALPQEFEFLTNLQGNCALVFNGHLFLRSQTYNNTSYWRCTEYKAQSHYCHAKLNLKETDGMCTTIVVKNGFHNHEPDEKKVEEWRVHNILRNSGILEWQGNPEKVKGKILELLPDCPERLLPKLVHTVTLERMKNIVGQELPK